MDGCCNLVEDLVYSEEFGANLDCVISKERLLVSQVSPEPSWHKVRGMQLLMG